MKPEEMLEKLKRNEQIDLTACKSCFLSQAHFLRFLYFWQHKNKVMCTKDLEYCLIQSRYLYREYLLLGIDSETKKIFSHLIISNNENLNITTDDDVKTLLDYDYNYYDSFQIQEDLRIRMQGDVIMRINKLFSNKQQLIEHLYEVAEESKFSTSYIFIQDFERYLTSKDSEFRNIMKELEKYFALEHRVIGLFSELRARQIIAQIQNEISNDLRPLLEKYEIKDAKIGYSTVEGIKNKIRAYYAERMLKNWLMKYEQNLEIRLGNPWSYHEIRTKGIIISREHEFAIIALTRPQQIQIIHPEHGINEFPFNYYAVVEFSLMR